MPKTADSYIHHSYLVAFQVDDLQLLLHFDHIGNWLQEHSYVPNLDGLIQVLGKWVFFLLTREVT